ncbi:MAG: hypothetical protein R6V72_14765 [Cyclobacterium sp.]|uniref:hypothetical protein n=1 Tax=Cyclobacterium sp. TaxID=1966343 RepID=UPI0039709E07
MQGPRPEHLAKDKTPEKLSIHRLPLESTNPSDSFDYLIMHKTWHWHVRSSSKPEVGEERVRG